MGHALALVQAIVVYAWAFSLFVTIQHLFIFNIINLEASVPAGSLLIPMHRCLELEATSCDALLSVDTFAVFPSETFRRTARCHQTCHRQHMYTKRDKADCICRGRCSSKGQI